MNVTKWYSVVSRVLEYEQTEQWYFQFLVEYKLLSTKYMIKFYLFIFSLSFFQLFIVPDHSIHFLSVRSFTNLCMGRTTIFP